MRFDEYVTHDGLGLARLVAAGEVHPSELVELAIQRIEQVNPSVNAVNYELFDRAREAARGPLPEGPFRGVPYLLKDMVAHAGTEVSFGSEFMRHMRFVPEHSHEVVRRSERAGLIFVGKTNAPEFGLLPITEPEAWGPTANPWNLAHSPGGSSGGTGAAVAAGMVPFAHGNDGGGSIRIPASCCGLFGLKPSRGRNPGIVTENPDGIVVEHCLSRTVRDSAALLDVTRGPLPGDRFWAPPPERPYLEEVGLDPAPLRIAFATCDFLGRPAHPDCRAAVEDAARLCEELGHHVEPARPDVDGERFNEAFAALWTSMAASVFAMILRDAKRERAIEVASRILGDRLVLEATTRLLTRSLRAPFEVATRRAAELGTSVTHADAFLVASELQRVSYQMAGFLESYDCYLTPVLASPPVRTGELTGLDIDRLRERVLAYGAYTPVCNAAGLPAMSVPLYWNARNLPVGVHFVTRFSGEATLFRLAGQLERARPWRQRYPASAA